METAQPARVVYADVFFCARVGIIKRVHTSLLLQSRVRVPRINDVLGFRSMLFDFPTFACGETTNALEIRFAIFALQRFKTFDAVGAVTATTMLAKKIVEPLFGSKLPQGDRDPMCARMFARMPHRLRVTHRDASFNRPPYATRGCVAARGGRTGLAIHPLKVRDARCTRARGWLGEMCMRRRSRGCFQRGRFRTRGGI